MKYLIALALIVISTSAMAQGINANSNALSQSQSFAGSESSNDGNNQNITFNTNTPANQEIKTVPPVSIDTPFPTADCMVGHSIGGSIMGFGIAGGTATLAEGCELRQNSGFLTQVKKRPDLAKIMECLKSEDFRKMYEIAGEPCPERTQTARNDELSSEDARLAVLGYNTATSTENRFPGDIN